MKASSIAFLAVAGALLLSSPAWADSTTTYASPTGSDTADCLTPAQACSLQSAIFTTPQGGTVIVAPGTYAAPPNSFQVSNDINIEGQAGQPMPTILADRSTCSSQLLCPYQPAIFLSGPSGSFSHIRVETRNAADATPAIVVANDSDSSEETLDQVVAESDDGPAIELSGDALIRDSVAWTPPGHTIGAIFGSAQDMDAATVRLENVTAVAQDPAAPALDLVSTCWTHDGCGTYVIAENSILRGGGSVPDITMASYHGVGVYGVTASHSNYDVHDAHVSDLGTDGNFNAEPQFVDPAGGDFHELASSPTVDAGISTPDLGATDLDGNSRTAGSAPDVGAYEFIPPAQQQQPAPQPQPQPSPVPQSGGSPSSAPSAPALVRFPGVKLRGRSLKERHGRVSVPIACPRLATGYCRGVVTLSRGANASKGPHVTFRLRPGQSRRVTLSLGRKLAMLRRFRATVTVVASDSNGLPEVTSAKVRVKKTA